MSARLPIGVLVMAYGGPASLEEIPGYLADIRHGRTTPPAVLGRLHDELERATATAKIQEMFARQGVRPVTSSAADFARRVSDETRRWRDVVAKAGVKVE